MLQAWGVLEFRQRDLAEARRLFQQGVWADPNSSDVAYIWQAWALLEWQSSSILLARRMFQCAMRADPRNAAALEVYRRICHQPTPFLLDVAREVCHHESHESPCNAAAL